MKIGIDATVFSEKTYTGIPRSVWEIIKVWKTRYPENEYYLFSKTEIHLPEDLPDNWHLITLRIRGFGRFWMMTVFPYLVRKYNVDVVWGTNYILPIGLYKAKKVLTVYDLSWYRQPEIASNLNYIKLRLLCAYSCRMADSIISISRSTANDIVNAFNIESSKVRVCYCGGIPSDKTDPEKGLQNKSPWYDMVSGKDYFLYLGTIEPRKNLVTLIKAYELFRNKTDRKTLLVLAGKRGWKCDNVYKAAEDSPYSGDIVMTGFVSDEEHDWLFKNAVAFVYPSLYEGFGIPVLEAVSFGLPIITSNNSSLPEVGGKAAFYIDNPTDEKELASQLLHVIELGDAEKEMLAIERKKQLAHFSWDRSAEETMQILCDTVLQRKI